MFVCFFVLQHILPSDSEFKSELSPLPDLFLYDVTLNTILLYKTKSSLILNLTCER